LWYILAQDGIMSIVERYVQCYNTIARDDLKKRIDKLRKLRYNLSIKLIGQPFGKILDVGGGDGGFLEEWGAKKEDCLIVDIAKPYIEEAKKKGFKTLLADVETVKLNKKFDIVTLNAVLEHVLHPEKLLLNIKRHMNIGSRLFIVVPYKEKIKKHPKYEFTHLRSIDEEYIRGLAKKSGFTVIRMKPFLAQFPGQVVFPLVREFRTLLPDDCLCKIFKPEDLFIEMRLRKN